MTQRDDARPDEHDAANIACDVANARSMSGAATVDTPLAELVEQRERNRTAVIVKQPREGGRDPAIRFVR